MKMNKRFQLVLHCSLLLHTKMQMTLIKGEPSPATSSSSEGTRRLMHNLNLLPADFHLRMQNTRYKQGCCGARRLVVTDVTLNLRLF